MTTKRAATTAGIKTARKREGKEKSQKDNTSAYRERQKEQQHKTEGSSESQKEFKT